MPSTADFDFFRTRLENELLQHPVILHNEYCQWFARAEHNFDDIRELIIQFSVFSNQFLIAQLHKMVNSVNLEEMHAAKEILANEIGAVFKPNQKALSSKELICSEGSVDGGTFHFKAAHFEWLLRLAKPLDLHFNDLGKRSHGTEETLFFCDELIRIYGNENFNISAGASFAVENWAAAGFWKELISGLMRFKHKHLATLNLSFFTWHDKVEDQHKAHTWSELEELYFTQQSFNEDSFIRSGYEMLNGVERFWNGLNQMRLKRQ